MKDHRKSVRVDANLFISYDILNKDGNVVQAGMALSEDLSRKGVKIKDRNTLPVDTSIKIHLAVGEEVVDLVGRVRHVQKVTGSNYQIGVEFDEVEKEMLDKIVKYYPDILEEQQ